VKNNFPAKVNLKVFNFLNTRILILSLFYEFSFLQKISNLFLENKITKSGSIIIKYCISYLMGNIEIGFFSKTTTTSKEEAFLNFITSLKKNNRVTSWVLSHLTIQILLTTSVRF
jgi:hypothetical protein